jgi:hypothetical protein
VSCWCYLSTLADEWRSQLVSNPLYKHVWVGPLLPRLVTVVTTHDGVFASNSAYGKASQTDTMPFPE